MLWGLNMQMLVYLAALVDGGEETAAGVLYMPAAEPSVPADRGADPASILEEAGKQLRMNGLVLSDQEIIQAMEAGAKGKFIPAALNKDGSVRAKSSALSQEELQTVLAYSKRLIAAMGEELLEGRVQASPVMKNKNTCQYCPYSPVCAREYSEKDVETDRPDSARSLAQMRETLEKGEIPNG